MSNETETITDVVTHYHARVEKRRARAQAAREVANECDNDLRSYEWAVHTSLTKRLAPYIETVRNAMIEAGLDPDYCKSAMYGVAGLNWVHKDAVLSACRDGSIGYVREGVIGGIRESLYTGSHLSVEKETNELIAEWKAKQ